MQTVYQPFRNFSMNNMDGKFDFLHLKDWTFVEMAPANQPFILKNLVLKGKCPKKNTTLLQSSSQPIFAFSFVYGFLTAVIPVFILLLA